MRFELLVQPVELLLGVEQLARRRIDRRGFFFRGRARGLELLLLVARLGLAGCEHRHRRVVHRGLKRRDELGLVELLEATLLRVHGLVGRPRIRRRTAIGARIVDLGVRAPSIDEASRVHDREHARLQLQARVASVDQLDIELVPHLQLVDEVLAPARDDHEVPAEGLRQRERLGLVVGGRNRRTDVPFVAIEPARCGRVTDVRELADVGADLLCRHRFVARVDAAAPLQLQPGAHDLAEPHREAAQSLLPGVALGRGILLADRLLASNRIAGRVFLLRGVCELVGQQRVCFEARGRRVRAHHDIATDREGHGVVIRCQLLRDWPGVDACTRNVGTDDVRHPRRRVAIEALPGPERRLERVERFSLRCASDIAGDIRVGGHEVRWQRAGLVPHPHRIAHARTRERNQLASALHAGRGRDPLPEQRLAHGCRLSQILVEIARDVRTAGRGADADLLFDDEDDVLLELIDELGLHHLPRERSDIDKQRLRRGLATRHALRDSIRVTLGRRVGCADRRFALCPCRLT